MVKRDGLLLYYSLRALGIVYSCQCDSDINKGAPLIYDHTREGSFNYLQRTNETTNTNKRGSLTVYSERSPCKLMMIGN